MNPQATFEQGVRRHRAGDLAGAEQDYLQTLTLDPGHADGWSNLGAVRAALGRPAESLPCYQQALQLQPQHPTALFNLGVALLRVGRAADALRCFETVRPLSPPTDQLAAQMGYALAALGRYPEAATALQEHLRSRPQDARAWHRFGHVLIRLGQDQNAITAFERASASSPDSPEARNSLGTAYEGAGRADEALACFREALRLRPDYPEALNNVGNAYVEAGRTAEAIGLLRQAVAGLPNWAAIHSNLLLAMNYRPDITPADLKAEHVAWATKHADPLTPTEPQRIADPSPNRRLRVGYLSCDFRRHPVVSYIAPVLVAHDRSAVHVTCYSATRRPDEVTARLRPTADAWRDIGGADDAAVADLIRQDQIDILVDLGGHTAGNRLLVMARRPAPVQVTHFGYPNTTGMKAIDFRLTSVAADPAGAEDRYIERLVRLPEVPWCWGPPSDVPDPGPPPCLKNGFITFASLNNPAKVTEQVAAVWARILARVPNSRLLLLTGQLAETRVRYTELFTQLGIDPRRLWLEPRQSAERYYALWAQADIGLDPFPYNGGVTTPDGLWMGVPLVAPAGDSYRGRQGLNVLGTVNLNDWVARSADEYIELAVRKASDPRGLAQLRAGLRERLRTSPVLDVPRFVQYLESAYRAMWHDRLGS